MSAEESGPDECVFCGCTDEDACEGGCSWVDEEHIVCSACYEDLADIVADEAAAVLRGVEDADVVLAIARFIGGRE